MTALKYITLRRLARNDWHWQCELCSAFGQGFNKSDATEFARQHRLVHNVGGVRHQRHRRID